jgi:hypothetical protein
MFSNGKVRALLLGLGGITVIVVASRLFEPRPTRAEVAVLVPLELVLLVDTSGSVDSVEYKLQKQGYVGAFRDAAIAEQIERLGGIAVVYIEWDDVDNQTVRIPWTHLRNRDDCLAFANAVDGIERATSGTTMIAPALAFAKAQVSTNAFMGMRIVIDVSGDGLCKNWRFYELGIPDGDQDDPSHYGTPWSEVVAGLVGTVDSVNGVYIGAADESRDFYRDILPQGSDSFTLHAETFEKFADTVKQKVMREVSVRIPGTYD